MKRFYVKYIFLIVLLILPLYAKGQKYNFMPIDKEFDSIASKLCRMDFENNRVKIEIKDLDKLYKIAEEKGNKQLKARALFWKARTIQMNASAQQCIPLLEQAKKLCSINYDYDMACINYQLAGNYERYGRYLEAYNLLKSTIPVFQKYEDHYFLGNVYLLFVQLYLDINDPENAKSPLMLAGKEYEKVKFPLNRIYFFQAYFAEGEKKLQLYKKSVESGKKDWGMTFQALTNISMLFLEKNQIDSAAIYDNHALSILEKNAYGNLIFTTLYNINHIKVLYAQKKYSEALTLLHEQEKITEMLKGEQFLTEIYEMLWKVSDKLGKKDEAYKYLEKYMNEYKARETEIRNQDLPKAKAREAIARSNDRINLLEKDAELNRTLMYVMILSIIILILVAVSVFVYLYQRYKIRKIENRELRNSLQQESLIYSINRQNFERDIKQKDCEISSSTLLLANKNEVLQQISDITKRYSEQNLIPTEYVKQINSVIGDSLKNDDEWSRFKLHFDSVHPGFFVKLKEISAELTENDLRLCAYVRIGIRAKQIAGMLSISPDSVNSNRYRLRKKLGLQHGESLDDFIRKI